MANTACMCYIEAPQDVSNENAKLHLFITYSTNYCNIDHTICHTLVMG